MRNLPKIKVGHSFCSFWHRIRPCSAFLAANSIGKRFGCNGIGLRVKNYFFSITTEATPDFSGHSHISPISFANPYHPTEADPCQRCCSILPWGNRGAQQCCLSLHWSYRDAQKCCWHLPWSHRDAQKRCSRLLWSHSSVLWSRRYTL